VTGSVDLAIRLARAAFNRALVEGNLSAIGPLLSADVVMVTGTDSAVIAGRKAQLLAWKREFAAKERMIYTRTPQTVSVSRLEPIAMELGVWQGAVGGTVQASGTYSAKWREVGGIWVIEAEIYVTMG
jgi:hypothetical protein